MKIVLQKRAWISARKYKMKNLSSAAVCNDISVSLMALALIVCHCECVGTVISSYCCVSVVCVGA